MIVILEKMLILWRCQSPYHHRRLTCRIRVSPYWCSTFHQISTLEKTTCRQCSVLSSLMSWRSIWVSLYLFVAYLTSSEVRSDFQIRVQIRVHQGFPMQSRQARSVLPRGIVMPISSSALSLLWFFLHLHFRVLFDIASRLLMELQWMMLNKYKRWFHLSRVKLPFVRMSASWFLVSMYLTWIFGS